MGGREGGGIRERKMTMGRERAGSGWNGMAEEERIGEDNGRIQRSIERGSQASRTDWRGKDSLSCEDLMVHVVQGGAVRHAERPEDRVPLLLDLFGLEEYDRA